jgi:hypothetical protein
MAIAGISVHLTRFCRQRKRGKQKDKSKLSADVSTFVSSSVKNLSDGIQVHQDSSSAYVSQNQLLVRKMSYWILLGVVIFVTDHLLTAVA